MRSVLLVVVTACVWITVLTAAGRAKARPEFALRDEPKRYDCGDPSANEQLILELVNRARANPEAEAKRLKIDLKDGLSPEQTALIGPKPPLVLNKLLAGAARDHSQDMFINSYMKHEDMKNRSPGDRMKDAGYEWRNFGENIAAMSSAKAREMHDMLIIDADVPGRGHRANLLGLLPGFIMFREIGIGLYSGKKPNTQGLRDFLTEDFGSTQEGPYIVGVVFRDNNGNAFYDPGEGMAGVTIKPDRGESYAVTSKSGGFGFPAQADGKPIRVSASGPGLEKTLVKEAALDKDNVKVDFIISK